MKFRSKLTVLLAAFALAACTSDFPVSGPRSEAVLSQRSETTRFALVKLTPAVIDTLVQYEPKGLAGTFTDRRPPASLRFGVGDVLSVSIFESAAGGLFIPAEAGVRPGNFVQLPDQTIDNRGNITVPYAGVVKAAGLDNVQVQNSIVERIKDRAIEPQVVIAVTNQRSSLISVLGEVNNPIRFPAAASGAEDRVTDAITRAGGIKGQGYESWVVLERGGRRATVPFENLISTAANNVYVQPGDRLYVYREPQKFLVFGAAGQQGEFPFDAWRINVAEAVAKAGGLVDTQADASAVFLYRREPPEVAAALGAAAPGGRRDAVPVVFQVDLSDPAGYFLATKMVVRNQDVLFIANARSVEIGKVLDLINAFTGTAANGFYAANSAYGLRANIRAR